MNNIKFVSPFKCLCMSIGALPTAYFESMTYYESLTYLVKFLEKEVIPAVNNNGKAVEELQGLFKELVDYVDNYFTNLDVQTEINNKLDEMAESGELAEIISEYLNTSALLRFDTISDMKDSENLSEGMIVACYGLNNINDGTGGIFKITDYGTPDEKTIISLQNSLFAHLINYFNENYYNISYTMGRAHDTDYYLTTVPYVDDHNEIIKLEVEADTNSPLEHAQKEYTSLTINATVPIMDSDDEFHETLVIGNGEILNPAYNFTVSVPNYYQYLCFDDERNYTSYQANITDSSTILNDGYTQAFLVFFKLITSGSLDLPTGSILLTREPRQMLGIKEDKTVIILTCDGRNDRNAGLTLEEGATILLNKGCIEAWNLDGGGSSSTIVKGSKINRNIDDGFTTDRPRPYTLNAKRTTINKDIANSYNKIGSQLHLLNKQILDYVNAQFSPKVANISFDGYTTTETANYEKIPLAINYDYHSGITYNSENKQLILKKGKYIVSGGYYVSSSNAENKFSAGYLNNTQLTILSLTSSAQNDRIQFNFDYILNVTSDDVPFDIRYYGTTGDAIQRGSLNIIKLNE